VLRNWIGTLVLYVVTAINTTNTFICYMYAYHDIVLQEAHVLVYSINVSIYSTEFIIVLYYYDGIYW